MLTSCSPEVDVIGHGPLPRAVSLPSVPTVTVEGAGVVAEEA